MTDYGIKIMQAGYGVTETDITKISLSSKYPMLKYHSSGTLGLSFVPTEEEQKGTVSHGLGYVPAFLVYRKDMDTGSEYMMEGIRDGIGYGGYFYAYAGTSDLVCGLAWPGGYPGTVNWDNVFRVVIFKDKIST